MSTISTTSNKNGFKSHIVPSVVTAALALSAAIPLTAAFASNASPVSADVIPVVKTASADNSCNAGTGVTTTSAHVMGASTGFDHHNNGGNGNNNGNGGGQGNGNGNGNTGQGNGNGNGSGSNANGNTQSNTGGLIGGVNAIVPVSALNGSLNGVLSGNTVSVPVLSNNNGNTTNVPVLNNVLNTLNNVL